MKFIILGTSRMTVQCTAALLEAGAEVDALISMPEKVRPNNAADVAGYAKGHGLAYHELEDINLPESVDLIRGYSPDYLFCTWPKMLKREILDTPRICVIGSHPTSLPFNRGRHPLHWLIALGILETQMSFFRMDEGVDSGNLLLQVPFQVKPDDSIADLDSAMDAAAYKGILSLSDQLLSDPMCAGSKQDQSLGNYWRMRTPHDVTLDPRMSSDMIMRTVRSFAPPYPCANLIFEDCVIKIPKASVFGIDSQITPEEVSRIEPGKIISIERNTIRLKVDDAIMDLECGGALPPQLLKAKYIHPPTKYVSERPDLFAQVL